MELEDGSQLWREKASKIKADFLVPIWKGNADIELKCDRNRTENMEYGPGILDVVKEGGGRHQ